MQKSPNQYEGEQENVHSEHLDVSLPVHASKRKGPEVTQSFIFKPRRKKCIVCAPKQAAGPQTVATAETCHYQGERTVIHEAERAANWPTCSLDPAAVYLTAQTGTGRRCKQQRDASSWIFCFIRLTFKMLSAAISVAALCKNLSASVSRHICCWAAGFKIHRKTDEHMKMLSNAPPTSFIQQLEASQSVLLLLHFILLVVEVSSYPTDVCVASDFWWFSTSGFVEKDGDVEAGGLWVCYRAESQTLQPIRTCEDDPQVSAVRIIPYSLRLWNHYSVRAEHVKRMCLGWESFPLPVLVSSLISIRKLQKSLRNSCRDPARSLKSKIVLF